MSNLLRDFDMILVYVVYENFINKNNIFYIFLYYRLHPMRVQFRLFRLGTIGLVLFLNIANRELEV